MSRAQQLEDQKQALLEKIRIRRAEYRMLLIPQERLAQGEHADDNVFPRSIAFKILTRHPYFLLGLAGALIFAGPRKSLIAAATSTAFAALQRYGMSYFFHSQQ